MYRNPQEVTRTHKNQEKKETRILAVVSPKLIAETQKIFKEHWECRAISLYEIFPKESKQVEEFFLKIEHYDYILLTSRNAVDFFYLQVQNFAISKQALPKVVALGEKTRKELEKKQIPVYLSAKEFSSKGLCRELSKWNLNQKTFLYPRSSLGSNILSQCIQKRGGRIESFVLYENQARELYPEEIAQIQNFAPQYVLFSSSSAVQTFFEKQILFSKSFHILSIGPKTTQTIKKYCDFPVLQSRVSTLEGLGNIFLSDRR